MRNRWRAIRRGPARTQDMAQTTPPPEGATGPKARRPSRGAAAQSGTTCSSAAPHAPHGRRPRHGTARPPCRRAAPWPARTSPKVAGVVSSQVQLYPNRRFTKRRMARSLMKNARLFQFLGRSSEQFEAPDSARPIHPLAPADSPLTAVDRRSRVFPDVAEASRCRPDMRWIRLF